MRPLSEHVIDLSGAVPHDVNHDTVPDLLRYLAREASAQPSWSTPARRGDDALLAAVAGLLDVRAEHVVICGGVRSFALCAASHFDDVAVERPTFMEIPSIFRHHGVNVSLFEAEELERVVDRLATMSSRRCIWITSPFRNPDGTSVARRQRSVLHGAISAGVAVVQNTVYRAYAEEPALVDGAIVVGSLHKLCGGGVRLGWVVHPELPPWVEAELSLTAPPGLWQLAWAHLLADPVWTDAVHRMVSATREAFAAFADSFCFVRPYSPHIILELDAVSSERDVMSGLAGMGLRVSPGSAFGCLRPGIRLSFAGLTAIDGAIAGSILKSQPGIHEAP